MPVVVRTREYDESFFASVRPAGVGSFEPLEPGGKPRDPLADLFPAKNLFPRARTLRHESRRISGSRVPA